MPLGDVPATADPNISEACQAIISGLAQTMMHFPKQGMANFPGLMIFSQHATACECARWSAPSAAAQICFDVDGQAMCHG